MSNLTAVRFSPDIPDGTNGTLNAPIEPGGVPKPDKIYRVPAREGRAFRLSAGEVLTIINTFGSQVADFWAFNAADLGEYLSTEHVRASLKRVSPLAGDALVSNRRRPIVSLLADTSPGVHDTLIAACDVHRYHQLGHVGYHDNCTDNLRMALRAIGLTPVAIPCPLNLWMNTPVRNDGSISWLPPVSSPGDRVEIRAAMDCVIVISACPMDILPINGEGAEPKDLYCSLRTS